MKPDTPTEASENAVFRRWEEALRAAYSLARAQRLAELHGDRRLRQFDGRGLHVYSTEWGRLLACEDLMPVLQGFRLEDEVDPVTLRRHAERDAEEEFAAEIRARS